MTDGAEAVDKLSIPKQTDFDADGSHAPMFEVPGILRKFEGRRRSASRSWASDAKEAWRPTCANCGERMEALPGSPKREPKSAMLYSGWFSDHCGSYFFLCES